MNVMARIFVRPTSKGREEMIPIPGELKPTPLPGGNAKEVLEDLRREAPLDDGEVENKS